MSNELGMDQRVALPDRLREAVDGAQPFAAAEAGQGMSAWQ